MISRYESKIMKDKAHVKNTNLHRINRAITSSKVRLIDHSGEMVGVVNLDVALSMANAENLDLVEVAFNNGESICKILDYSKFLYNTKKKAHGSKKKSKVVKIKEIKIRPTIGENDYITKFKSAREFLEEGHKVKVTVRLKGRELLFKNLAVELLKKFNDDLLDVAKVETPIKNENAQFQIVFVPNKVHI